ncbi:MAG: hypothetical protein HFF90_13635 [Oscillibacter sp.]|nr:hypothetical protein [Oscillibacter sp.]
MERYRLKNIIILILVLVNAFLLASLSMRKSAEQDAFRRTAEELVELFAADGMTLDAYAISREAPPSGVALVRDPDLEAKAAAFLLGGSPAYADSGGGIYQYRTDAGTVLFRSSGGFEAAGTFGAGRGEDFCREFCRTFSFSEPLFQYEENSGLNGTASAVFLYSGLPVFNCTVTFTLEDGAVTAASGALLPQASSSAAPAPNAVEPLSAAGALAAFQRMRREQVAVVSAVVGTSPCYELQNAASPLSLAPAWQIATDTENYYVNCYTGAVTVG